MRFKIKNLKNISIFLLVYYVYFNSLRKYFIPFSSISIPLILLFFLYCTISGTDLKIKYFNAPDKLLCYSWILIIIMITINNVSLFDNLINGGMIQLFVMIAFLLFVPYDTSWIDTWIKWTRRFVIIHAVATIVFYFNSTLYTNFVNLFFSSEIASSCLRYYRMGYMSGLCTHFSSNGMVLCIGLAVEIENLLSKKGSQSFDTIKTRINVLIILYALILTSKRGPLIAIVFSIIVTFIISAKKNVIKRLLLLVGVAVFVVAFYFILAPKIPGLTIIVDKFKLLANSDAGILNGREGLWDIAISMFKENPLFGKGYGSYKIISTELGAISTSAHNYYLQLMAEYGLVGLVIYMFAFLCSVLSTYLLLSNSLLSRYQRFIVCISFDIQLFIIIYSISATTLMYYYILIPFMLACSITRSVNKEIRIQL